MKQVQSPSNKKTLSIKKSPIQGLLIQTPSNKQLTIVTQESLSSQASKENISRIRSCSFKHDQLSQITGTATKLLQMSAKDKAKKGTTIISKKKVTLNKKKAAEKRLSDMSPREITNLLKENQQLRGEITFLQALMQEVMPVFQKITEDLNEESTSFHKSNLSIHSFDEKQQVYQSSSSHNNNLMATNEVPLIPHSKRDEVAFLQQSLKHLNQIYEQKEEEESDDSEFLDAEDLDSSTLDEMPGNQLRIRQSNMTFGDNNIGSPESNNQQIQYIVQKKTKIADLNKQSKNFNMPMTLEVNQFKRQSKQQRIIEFDEIKKVKDLLQKINNTSILQELRSSKKLNDSLTTQQKNKELFESRNKLMDGINSYISGNVSMDSGISDDDVSIPPDSFLQKNLLNSRIMPQVLEQQKSPFNRFSIQNTYKESGSQLQDSKLPQRHELTYPKSLITENSKNFNSLHSINSCDSDNPPIELIKETALVQQNASSPQISFKKEKSNIVLSQVIEIQNDKIQVLDEDDQSIKFSHQIREVNFDMNREISQNMNEEKVLDFYFESQSRDCFQFTHSITTEQIPLNSKRESMDPLAQLFRNESPVKVQQQTPFTQKQVFRRESLEPIESLDETVKVEVVVSNYTSKRQSLGSSGYLKDKENAFSSYSSPKKTPLEIIRRANEQKGRLPSSNDESLPILQVLNIQQEERPHLEMTQSVNQQSSLRRKDKFNSKSYQTSINHSPIKSGKINLQICQKIEGHKRGKSQAQYQSLGEQVKQSIIDLKSYQSQKQDEITIVLQEHLLPQTQKWMSIEEKEKSLINLNKEAIRRGQESQLSMMPLATDYKVAKIEVQEEINQVLNLKMSNKLEQNLGLPNEETNEMIEFSTSQIIQTSCLNSDRLVQQPCEQPLKPLQSEVESFEMSQPAKQLIEMKRRQKSDVHVGESPLLTLVDDISSKNSQNTMTFDMKKISEQAKIIQQQQESQIIKDSSPKILMNQHQTPQYSFEQIRQLNNEIKDRRQSSNIQTKRQSFEPFKRESVSQRPSGTGYCTQESDSHKSYKLENLMQEYLKESSIQQEQQLDPKRRFSALQESSQNPSPIHQITSHQSSQEQIVISAHPNLDLTPEPQPQVFCYPYQNPTYTPLKVQNFQEIPDDFQGPTLVLDITITPQNESVNELLRQQNSIIEEQPSIEEQESRPIINIEQEEANNFQNIRVSGASLLRDDSSKVSLTNIDMQESEIFSIKNQSITSPQQQRGYGSIVQTSKNSITKVLAQENSESSKYNSSRYRTPLRHFINSGVKSNSRVQTPRDNNQKQSLIQNSQTDHTTIQVDRSLSTRNTLLSNNQQQIKTPRGKDQKTPRREIGSSSILARKANFDNHSQIITSSQKPNPQQQQHSSRLEHLSQHSNQKLSAAKSKREQLLKERLDYLQDKLDKKMEKIQQRQSSVTNTIIVNDEIQVVENPETVQNYRSQSKSCRVQYQSQKQQQNVQNAYVNLSSSQSSAKKQRPPSIANKSTLSCLSPTVLQQETPQQRIIPTSAQSANEKKEILQLRRQSDLEEKLKEKEGKIKEIIDRKKVLEDQRNQIRLLKEQTAASARKNDQTKLNLQGGLSLRTPSRERSLVVQNKIVVKKETTYNSNKQQFNFQINTDKAQRNNFTTIESNRTFSQQNTSRKPNALMEPQVSNKTIESVTAPVTERSYQFNLKETFSPVIQGLQPTHRQMEFFKKIEGDCNRRRLMKQQIVQNQQ